MLPCGPILQHKVNYIQELFHAECCRHMGFSKIMVTRQGDKTKLLKNILWMSTNKNQEHYELKQQIRDTSASAILNSSRKL